VSSYRFLVLSLLFGIRAELASGAWATAYHLVALASVVLSLVFLVMEKRS
jgi:hypothetical protein